MIADKGLPIKTLGISKAKVKDYTQLLKLRLTGLVVFSAIIGFFLASTQGVAWPQLFALALGSFLVVGASNAINQIIEKDSDKLMSRTASRPLADGRMEVREAVMASLIMGITGVALMGLFLNQLSAALALMGLIIYAFAYTPLKKVNPIAVFVGGIAGAIPPMSGFVAASGEITGFAVVLFTIQFFWQFPHFWAIAWVMKEEYDKAGIKLLPMGSNKDRIGAIQIMMLTLVLIPVSLLPAMMGYISFWAAITSMILSCLFFIQSFKLFYDLKDRSALQLMFGSFMYLPIVLIIFFIDQLLV
jgi:protoheme IX farnesyltransferase